MIGHLTVHIGPPKTGTTAIQEALQASRSDLARQGVSYGAASNTRADHLLAAHLWAANREAGRSGGPTDDWRWFLGLASLESLLSEYSSGSQRRIISCEDLAGLPSTAIRGLLDAIQPADIEVVVGARTPAQWLFSLWQQNCKIPNAEPWGAFVERARRDRLLFMSRSAESWVGDARVSRAHVLPMIIRHDPGLVIRFAEVAGIELPDTALRRSASTRPNAGLGVIEALLVAGAATRVAHFASTLTEKFGRLDPATISRHLMDLTDLARPYFEMARTLSIEDLFHEPPFDRGSEASVRAYCAEWADDALEFAKSGTNLTESSRQALVDLSEEARSMVQEDPLWAPHPTGYPRDDFPELIRQSAVTVANDRLLANTIGLIHLRSVPTRNED